MSFNRYISAGILALVLVPGTLSAQGLNPDINGVYTKGASTILDVRSRGSIVVVADVNRRITYRFDLSTTGEQEFPPRYYEFLRTRKEIGAIGSLIRKVTISNVKVASANRLEGVINYYFGTTSIFGTLGGKVRIGMAVEFEPSCNERRNCLHVSRGGLQLSELSTGLGNEINRALGMILDLAAKLISPDYEFGEGTVNNRLE